MHDYIRLGGEPTPVVRKAIVETHSQKTSEAAFWRYENFLAIKGLMIPLDFNGKTTMSFTSASEKRAIEIGGVDSPISVRTLQRWRLEGTGSKYIKLGRLVRYRKSDLDEFIQSNCLTSTSDIAA